MPNITYFTTPSGDEMAVLPRHELEDLMDAKDHAKAIDDYQRGVVPGLTVDEARALIDAPSPLAFWRKYRGLTQSDLAASIGIKQGYLSDIESGKRGGNLDLWFRIAEALDLPIEEVTPHTRAPSED